MDMVVLGGAMGAAISTSKAYTDSVAVTKADLVNGKVPASELPSYVDDVLEYPNLAAFPATGESGKIYVALDTNYTYRWTGSAYVRINEVDLSAYRTAAAQDVIDATKVDKSQGVAKAGHVMNIGADGNISDIPVDSTPTASSDNLIKSGGVHTALDTKMDKTNPTGSGAITIGTRKNGSTVGLDSTAIGDDVTASDDWSVAIGSEAQATGPFSLSFGYKTKATGQNSVAIGTMSGSSDSSIATGYDSFAHGASVLASGNYSTARGVRTVASGSYSIASGNRTTASALQAQAHGIQTIASKPRQIVSGVANVEDAGDGSGNGLYARIVGNGTVNASNEVLTRSNAFALGWDGTGHFAGDVYVGCNADSTGGSKVAIESAVIAKSQGVAHAGEFLVVGADGNVTTQSLATWQGGNY